MFNRVILSGLLLTAVVLVYFIIVNTIEITRLSKKCEKLGGVWLGNRIYECIKPDSIIPVR